MITTITGMKRALADAVKAMNTAHAYFEDGAYSSAAEFLQIAAHKTRAAANFKASKLGTSPQHQDAEAAGRAAWKEAIK